MNINKFSLCRSVYSLSNNKFLDPPKMNAFAENVINVTQRLKFVCFWKIEKHCAETRNCWRSLLP